MQGCVYKLVLVAAELGWADLDLRCSTILLGQWVATIAAHQPGEHLKSKSSQPNSETTTRITLYSGRNLNLGGYPWPIKLIYHLLLACLSFIYPINLSINHT